MSKKNYTKYSENKNNENVTIEEVNEVIESNEEENNEINVEPIVEEELNIDEENKDSQVDNNTELKEIQNENNVEKDSIKVFINGMVANCKKLNVRSEAKKDSDVLCVINEGTELRMDDKLINDFYKVYFEYEGIIVEGYCLKDFIELK